MATSHSLTIVGDWFVAESVSAEIGRGYRQTIFTRHAPTINTRIELFDEEFDALLKRKEIRAEDSTKHAIEEIEAIIQELKWALELGRIFYNMTLENVSSCDQYDKEHPDWKALNLTEKDVFYQMAANTVANLWDQGYHLIRSKVSTHDEGLDVDESHEDEHFGICPRLFATPEPIGTAGELTTDEIEYLSALLEKEGFEINKK